MFNGQSAISNSNSFSTAADDAKVRSLPLMFRYLIPGFEAGWPAR